MKCNNIEYKLIEYIEGKLSEQERADTLSHISICRSCSHEYELLMIIYNDLKKNESWSPSQVYWTSLLPRIHNRIKEKSSRYSFEPLVRFALPITAAFVLIVALFHLPYTFYGSDSYTSDATLQQLPESELQDYIHAQAVVDLGESLESMSNSVLSSDDITVVKNILTDEEQVSSSIENDQDTIINDLSSDTEDEIVTILSGNIHPV